MKTYFMGEKTTVNTVVAYPKRRVSVSAVGRHYRCLFTPSSPHLYSFITVGFNLSKIFDLKN
jgi:hypothetical protein